jgi:hypothetical protein
VLQCTSRVLRRDNAVEHIEKFSVQLINAECRSLKPFCSGVLVELDGHYFILTAGHCVEYYYDHRKIHLRGMITRPPFEADIFEVGIKLPEPVLADWPGALVEDYGFYELDPRGIEAVHDNGKCFLGKNNLCVHEEKKFLEAWTRGILSGFPLCMTEVIKGAVRSRFLTLNMSPDMVSYSPGNYRKCINIDLPQTMSDDLPASLEGTSGGGFWIQGREELNNPLNLKLAGINVGTPKSNGTEIGRKMMVTLVGHHLRRIADLTDDLEDLILGTWCFLRNDAWNTMHRS